MNQKGRCSCFSPPYRYSPRHRCEWRTEEIARLYFDENLSPSAISQRIGMSIPGIGKRLRKAGYVLRKGSAALKGRHFPKFTIPTETLRHLYFDELLSVELVARRVGMHFGSVRTRLLNAGYKLRQRSEAHKHRLYHMTALDRREIWYGGRRHSFKKALAWEHGAIGKPPTAESEIKLLEMLNQRGINNLVRQKAVGPYNVDFASDAIAVEIIWTRRQCSHYASTAERIYYILKCGFHMIEILIRESWDPLQNGAVDQVIAFFDSTKSLPSIQREYRMVGGAGQLLAVFQIEVNNGAGIFP